MDTTAQRQEAICVHPKSRHMSFTTITSTPLLWTTTLAWNATRTQVPKKHPYNSLLLAWLNGKKGRRSATRVS